MKKLKMFVILIIVFIFTGCINYKELDDLSLISAIGFDYQDGKFSLILQEVSAELEGEDSEHKYIYHQVSCEVIKECILNIHNTTDKELYFFTTETILINKEIYSLILPDIHHFFSDINDHAFIFLTHDDISSIFKHENNFQYINNINSNDLNSLIVIRKSIMANQVIHLPVVAIEQDEIIIVNEFVVRVTDET